MTETVSQCDPAEVPAEPVSAETAVESHRSEESVMIPSRPVRHGLRRLSVMNAMKPRRHHRRARRGRTSRPARDFAWPPHCRHRSARSHRWTDPHPCIRTTSRFRSSWSGVVARRGEADFLLIDSAAIIRLIASRTSMVVARWQVGRRSNYGSSKPLREDGKADARSLVVRRLPPHAAVGASVRELALSSWKLSRRARRWMREQAVRG